jgi:hypothetical protein
MAEHDRAQDVHRNLQKAAKQSHVLFRGRAMDIFAGSTFDSHQTILLRMTFNLYGSLSIGGRVQQSGGKLLSIHGVQEGRQHCPVHGEPT